MEANELRYGNLLHTNRMELNEVICINTLSRHPETNEILLATNYFPHLLLSQCEPIPLTEEWLLKFGFSKKDVAGCDPYYFYNNEFFEIGWRVDEHLDVSFSGNNYSNEFPHIKYVHQLQNLFFALTGEELTTQN